MDTLLESLVPRIKAQHPTVSQEAQFYALCVLAFARDLLQSSPVQYWRREELISLLNPDHGSRGVVPPRSTGIVPSHRRSRSAPTKFPAPCRRRVVPLSTTGCHDGRTEFGTPNARCPAAADRRRLRGCWVVEPCGCEH
jgi:hypothetical protein